MQFYKKLMPLALASLATAQTQESITDALNSQNASLSVLNGLLSTNPDIANALGGLNNVTLLAPNNDALTALISDTGSASILTDTGALLALLQYHVLDGTIYASDIGNTSTFVPTALTNSSYTNVTGGQVVEAQSVDGNVTFFSALKQNVTVVTANVNFTGGTIHIIDGVLTIPLNDTETIIDANLTAAAGALSASGLEEGLGSLSDVTIFVPNNDAFSAIGSVLANASTDDIVNILGYHVINGTVAYSTDLGNTTITAFNGEQLTITVEDGAVFVNAARVIEPDLLVENGVIHVIDQVLNPSNTTATPNPSATSVEPAFSGASSVTTGVPFTSGVSTPTTTFPAASATSSSSKGPAMPIKTGAVGAAALFGGAVVLVNL
ncbi:FAS1 domain-containing protein [Xylariales sp. PMI_506]|nr:FAS1 domain-containing protein [Xylariales sp. PMI_506]